MGWIVVVVAVIWAEKLAYHGAWRPLDSIRRASR
jgi:hypothetical protein